jgi:AcrR family transcriptional regulator
MEAVRTRRGRRTASGELVRDALVRAGQTLFSAQPVDAVAIDDIVREGGVAKGSFYKHFPDKEALLTAVVRRIYRRIEAEVTAANAAVDDAAARVARAICVYLRYVADEPEQGGVLVRNNRVGWTLPVVELNPGTAADIRKGLLAGRFVTPTVEAGALLVQGAAHSGLTRFAGRPGDAANTPLAQQLCQLVLSGLGVPPAEAQQLSAAATRDILHSPRGEARRSEDLQVPGNRAGWTETGPA